MTPERWARIKEVFGAATETTAAERAAYLESACGADSDLRGEVERLLADHATETLASPAAGVLAQVPKLTPGEMLAHYQVEAKLGEGGMGAVYRAYDTQLERQVAVKVLLPDPYADPDRKQRLMREARAASALNHPNIVTVHEIGSDRGVDFIAMEYVDGRSLDKLIPSRGVPVARALDYAIQIADALAKAHATGVVHRDLKPANIMVTAEGRVKLLDFGLARRVALAEGTTASLTVPGTVAGTPAYMSPEQAEGKKTDHRSDVFSFGVVLYEMLTGHRAFAGQTTLALLAAVLHEEPQPVRKIVPAVPRELERLVALCIKKDPARRLQHIDDIAIELQALRDDKAAVEPEAAAPKPRLRVKVASIAALPVLAAVLGLTLWIGRTEKPVTAPELLPLTFDSGLTTQPVISPDGKLLAYASDRGGEGNLDIWVQQMGGSGPIRLTQDTADEHDPDFSPDGTQIAFHSKRAGGGIYVIPALGGEARLVVAPGRAPRFSPDGSQIAYWVGGNVSAARGAAVFVIGTAGGRPQQLSRDFVYGSYPTWATDGNHVLFFGARELHGNLDWWVTPVGGGPAIKAGLMAVLPVRLRSESYERGFRVIDPNAWFHDELIFSDSAPGAPGSTLHFTSNLWRIPISSSTLRVSGKPRQLTFGTGLNHSARVSADGQVVFSNGVRTSNIWSLPIETSQGKVTGGLRRLTQGTAHHTEPCLSPDGQKMLYVAGPYGRGRVVLKDIAGGKETLLAAPGFLGGSPAYSPDGSRIAVWSEDGERRPIYIVPVGGGAEKVCEHCGLAPAWSSDGARILYDWGVPRYVGLLEVSTGKTVHILKHPTSALVQARFSPDDRWISFVEMAAASGRTRLMVVPFRGAAIPESQWVTVTDGSATDMRPRWSPDGNLLYYHSNRDGFRCLWAQRLDPVTKRPAGSPFSVYHFHSARLALTTLNQGISVGRDKIVMSLQELTGNIWTFKLPEEE